MHFIVTEKSARLGDVALSPTTTKEDLLHLLGTPNRTDIQSCSLSTGGSRTAYVYDELGLLFYHDLPENKLSHLVLALSSTDTPQQPARPFCGNIHFTSTPLDEHTSAQWMARTHGKLLNQHAHSYYYDADDFSCWFLFEKSRDARGKRAGPYLLASIHLIPCKHRPT